MRECVWWLGGYIKGGEGGFFSVMCFFFFFPSWPLWVISWSSEQINLPLDCLPVLSMERFLIYFSISDSKGIVSIWIHLTFSSFFSTCKFTHPPLMLWLTSHLIFHLPAESVWRTFLKTSVRVTVKTDFTLPLVSLLPCDPGTVSVLRIVVTGEALTVHTSFSFLLFF